MVRGRSNVCVRLGTCSGDTMTVDAFLATAFASSNLVSIAFFFTLMAAVAATETVIPLHARDRRNRAHIAPNLALTAIYFTMNLFFTAALMLTLAWLQTIGFGLLNTTALDPLVAVVAAVVVLDFSAYAVHVAMHETEGLWRFHRVHHSDAVVDVTTSIRQHPGESLVRYAALALFAVALGASPAAFAIYRLWSGIQALVEHANVRLPLWLDDVLALVVTTPNYHKVHHSREARETDSNYGNIFTIWDRLFFTATPARRGPDVGCGLDGLDSPADQSLRGLLALPFRQSAASGRVAGEA